MSRSVSGDVTVVAPRDDDDVSMVLVDHVPPPPPSSARRASSWRQPGPGPITADSSLSIGGCRSSQNNNRRKSPSPSPRPSRRLSVANATLTPRPLTSSSLRRKSVAAHLQPVSPEPDLHHAEAATSLRRPVGGTTHGVGYRLGRRKVLGERRKRLADYSLVFAMFGVVSMMVEMELTMAELYDKVGLFVSRTTNRRTEPNVPKHGTVTETTTEQIISINPLTPTVAIWVQL